MAHVTRTFKKRYGAIPAGKKQLLAEEIAKKLDAAGYLVKEGRTKKSKEEGGGGAAPPSEEGT